MAGEMRDRVIRTMWSHYEQSSAELGRLPKFRFLRRRRLRTRIAALVTQIERLERGRKKGVSQAVSHEPTDECAAVHCWGHDLDEPREDVWRECFECKHAYRSPEELRREWAKYAPPEMRNDPAPAVLDIDFCPVCMHGW